MKSIFYPYLIKVFYTTTHVDGEKGNLCANVKGKSIEMTLELWMDIVGLSSVGMIANEKGLEDEEVTFNKLATYKMDVSNEIEDFVDPNFEAKTKDEPMVISIVITNFMVSKVLIDQGSSTNTLYWKTFKRLKVSPDIVQPHYGLLLDYLDLMTTFGQGKLSRNFTVRYLIIDSDTSYFALIGRETLNELGTILSTPHLKMKFPTFTGKIITVKVNQKQTHQCYVESLKVALYPPIRESDKPHPTSSGSSQVMNMDEESKLRTLVFYETTRIYQDGVFDVDPWDDIFHKGLKPIEELVKLELGHKPR
ncbi:hypothetical protein JHK84_047713 [Glycine max]|uniref:Uncharacterized protein n=2 Tax=Glycine subgen. Soja TaxID=1462606 RepID=A0A0R0FQH2_SOYBN|nr:hypothetical protein JHK86_047690 [Glycine max]KAG4943660.1 hypothetical protein JHK85_048306 [Glycine max]KAG5102744.1 hypothetical protein JHK84_047713 [Glycine max]RZB57284.1 hypothetical protein D0Y65_046090 [Glycine soja]